MKLTIALHILDKVRIRQATALRRRRQAGRDDDATLQLHAKDQNVTLAFAPGQLKAVQAFVRDAFGPV